VSPVWVRRRQGSLRDSAALRVLALRSLRSLRPLTPPDVVAVGRRRGRRAGRRCAHSLWRCGVRGGPWSWCCRARAAVFEVALAGDAGGS